MQPALPLRILALAFGVSLLMGGPGLAQFTPGPGLQPTAAPPPLPPAGAPGLQPVPEAPPAPPDQAGNAEPQPEITTVRRGQDTVEEYRMGGKLYMMKVTPPGGVPYYLIDHRGDGVFSRQQSLDSGLRPPMWVIFRF